MKRAAGLVGMCLVGVLAVGCGPKTPKATVAFSQFIEPKSPLSSQYMQIAVMNANMEGSSDEVDQTKWAGMTADMMQHYLEQASEKYNIPIKLVDREHLKIAMGEKDLAAAGITDSGDEVAASQVKGASAILTSKVTVKIDKQVGKQRSIDAMSVFASAWGGGGGISTEEVDEEARNITVTCQFQLKDPATNDIVVSHSAMPSQEYAKTSSSFFFGSSKTEADMSPRDKVIGAMIEKHAQDFLAKFVPVETFTEVTVEPSKNENSIAGVRSLVMDEYESALAKFKAAISEDQNDDESLFGAGVACEKLKRYDEARKYYKLAQSLDTENANYNAAVARIGRMG
ncbi:MAG: tetratricopeptide repeat protein [Planctomycetia bacterium]|nr:tetratricopeptide repeat protein [Planctomycetia bacterium]MCC7315944.1 tetratricopeptide repeat protein [Planctomycetota bacterium]